MNSIKTFQARTNDGKQRTANTQSTRIQNWKIQTFIGGYHQAEFERSHF